MVWERLHPGPPEDLDAVDPPSDVERLARVLALGPGPGPMSGVHLAGIDPRGLVAPGKVRLVQAWEAQVAFAQAGQARALAALDDRDDPDAAAPC